MTAKEILLDRGSLRICSVAQVFPPGVFNKISSHFFHEFEILCFFLVLGIFCLDDFLNLPAL